jgi:MFS family permease
MSENKKGEENMDTGTHSVGTPPGVDSWWGWMVVGATLLSTFTVFGIAYSFGAFFSSMAKEFGEGRGAISLMFSITAFLYFGLGMLSGRAADRFGPRPVVAVGALVMALGLILTSLADRLWIGSLTYGVGVGVGVSCGYVPLLAAVGGWFERHRAIASGVAVEGVGLGTLLIAPLAAELISSYGWRTTYVIFGLGAPAILAVCMLGATRPPLRPGEPEPLPIGKVVRISAFRWFYLSALLMSMTLFVPFVFLAAFAEEHGTGKVLAASLLGVIGGGSIMGRLGLAALGDWLGRMRVLRGSFLLLAVSFLLWLGAGDSFKMLFVFAIVMGIAYGGFIALSPAVTAEMFGLAGLGGVMGALYTAAGVGGLIGPPLAGLLIDFTNSYTVVIISAAVLSFVAFVCLLPIKPVVETLGKNQDKGGQQT